MTSFNPAKLDFVDCAKRILWVAFSRKRVDVRGDDFREDGLFAQEKFIRKE